METCLFLLCSACIFIAACSKMALNIGQCPLLPLLYFCSFHLLKVWEDSAEPVQVIQNNFSSLDLILWLFFFLVDLMKQQDFNSNILTLRSMGYVLLTIRNVGIQSLSINANWSCHWWSLRLVLIVFIRFFESMTGILPSVTKPWDVHKEMFAWEGEEKTQ